MVWHRRVAKYVALAAALHFVLDALALAAAFAVLYFGLGCAALQCEPGDRDCVVMQEDLDRWRAMTARRQAQQEALISNRAVREGIRADRRRR